MKSIEIDRFVDSRFYPSPSDPPQQVANFFFVAVALDHRVYEPGERLCIAFGTETLCGTDALYRMLKEVYEEDPKRFEPESLARLSIEDLRRWLCRDGKCVRGLEIRAMLLRDLGEKCLKLFGRSFLSIVERCDGYLRREDGEGLIDLVKVFKAFQDPVEKKPFLLAKMLERRGLINVKDPYSKRVPVDNHVVRIALRLGLVKLGRDLLTKVVEGREVDPYEDVLIRMCIREAWQRVCLASSLDPFVLDDALWTFGRTVCLVNKPRCLEGRIEVRHPFVAMGRCIFEKVCPVARGEIEPLNEHQFWKTWWY